MSPVGFQLPNTPIETRVPQSIGGLNGIRASEASAGHRTRPSGASGSFSPSFYESSEACGLADRANGDFVAVSRERFAGGEPDAVKSGSEHGGIRTHDHRISPHTGTPTRLEVRRSVLAELRALTLGSRGPLKNDTGCADRDRSEDESDNKGFKRALVVSTGECESSQPSA